MNVYNHGIETKRQAVTQYHIMEALTTTVEEDRLQVIAIISEEWQYASDAEVLEALESIMDR